MRIFTNIDVPEAWKLNQRYGVSFDVYFKFVLLFLWYLETQIFYWRFCPQSVDGEEGYIGIGGGTNVSQ
jgi:hypothetical protein